MDAEAETYVDAVGDALRMLGGDPMCLVDSRLFEVMAEYHFVGAGPTEAANAVLERMRAREVNSTRQ